jgi:hypothetical protein
MKTQTCSYGAFSDRIKANNYNIPIFKFMPFEYVVRTLKDNQLLVAQTQKWEDVYENFLLKTRMSSEIKKYLPVFYGQCWSFRRETDALWRIYSPSKDSVRIKTTIKKLAEVAVQEKNAGPHTLRHVIAPVRYFTPSQFTRWMKAKKRSVVDDSSLCDSLFIKRTEFSHESEIRLIMMKDVQSKEKYPPFIRLDVQPNKLIDEITFDPRLTTDRAELKTHILRTMGYNRKVNKSSLYDFKLPGIS